MSRILGNCARALGPATQRRQALSQTGETEPRGHDSKLSTDEARAVPATTIRADGRLQQMETSLSTACVEAPHCCSRSGDHSSVRGCAQWNRYSWDTSADPFAAPASVAARGESAER